MNTLNVLADLHIRESEARLRHVDELMATSQQGSAKGLVDLNWDVQVDRIQSDRDRLALGFDRVRGLPQADAAAVAGRTEVLSGVLGAIGLELEKALAAVLVTGHK